MHNALSYVAWFKSDMGFLSIEQGEAYLVIKNRLNQSKNVVSWFCKTSCKNAGKCYKFSVHNCDISRKIFQFQTGIKYNYM